MNLGGYLPQRRAKVEPMAYRALRVRATAEEQRRSRDLDDDGVRAALQILVRDKVSARHRSDRAGRVPHVRMEGFRQLGIWNQQGQLYTPEDADQLMFYKEARPARSCRKDHEAGGICDWIAAATSYSRTACR